MIKAKKSGTSTQKAMEAAGDVDGYEYLMWLVPFIAQENKEQHHFYQFLHRK